METTENIWKDFYKISRLLVQEYNTVTAFHLLELAIEDVANETWMGKPFEFEVIEEKKEIKIDPKAKLLKDKIKITDIAEMYGLKVKKNKAICPFHADSDPSLSFSNDKGIFHCFGCGAKGDLVTFLRKLEELNEKK